MVHIYLQKYPMFIFSLLFNCYENTCFTIGHIAAALDSNRMLIFGGKGAGGRNLRDTWIYYYDADRWRQVSRNDELSLPLPKARYFSACVSVPIPPLSRARETSAITCRMKETDRDVYMFGGMMLIDESIFICYVTRY